MGMIVIGNGEPCPFCGKHISDSASETFAHIDKEHHQEQMDRLFPQTQSQGSKEDV